MRIEIEIPKEFEEHFNQDKFKDSFGKIMTDINYSFKNADYLCSKYEYETIEMLQKAFENSRQAYPVDKVVEELTQTRKKLLLRSEDCEKIGDYCGAETYAGLANEYLYVIKIVKQGGAVTEAETIRDKAIKWNNNSSKRVPYEFIDYVEGKREIVVSDDVCEWKLNGVYLISPHPLVALSCITNYGYRYNYCPVCGKKIKAVE